MFTLIKNATIVNEHLSYVADVLIKNQRIEKISNNIAAHDSYHVIEAEGLYLIPGCIDDQVHFREPGLTHKACIKTESRAAVAGGVTSFMEMPNTNPPATTQQLLEDKYNIAEKNSIANYSFFMGTSNDNYDEVMRTSPKNVCGIKIFMGSSTGNMLVDNENYLEKIFANTPTIIATHCEDEMAIKNNLEKFESKANSAIFHPLIRDVEACYLSSSKAVSLAKKYNTPLHVLHISTAKELDLFNSNLYPNITAEACVHHLWYCDKDYNSLDNQIKCNPAIKSIDDRDAIRKAINNGVIKVIATDHAPHTWDEKQQEFLKAPSGLPLVQHGLLMMLDLVAQNVFTFHTIVDKMCHQPAILFNILERGFIREGYYADMVLIDLNKETEVSKNNILYQCAWSPLEGHKFSSSIHSTWVNGNLVFQNNTIKEGSTGMRMLFDR